MLKVYSFVLRYGLAIGLAVLVTLQVVQWYRPGKTVTAWRVQPTPYVAASRSDDLDFTRSRVAIPALEVQSVPVARRQAIERKLGGALPTGPILTAVDIRALCNGGTAIVSLEPTPDGQAQQAKVTIYPKKPSLFELRLEREVFVGVGQAYGSQSGRVWNAEVTQSLFRVGPATVKAKAGFLGTPFGTTGYVVVGASATF